MRRSAPAMSPAQNMKGISGAPRSVPSFMRKLSHGLNEKAAPVRKEIQASVTSFMQLYPDHRGPDSRPLFVLRFRISCPLFCRPLTIQKKKRSGVPIFPSKCRCVMTGHTLISDFPCSSSKYMLLSIKARLFAQ